MSFYISVCYFVHAPRPLTKRFKRRAVFLATNLETLGMVLFFWFLTPAVQNVICRPCTNYDNFQYKMINMASYLQECRNIIEAGATNPITELGNKLLDNLNCLIRWIDLKIIGNRLRQDNVYQVIQVIVQLQISLDLTNKDQETLGKLKDLFDAMLLNLTHLCYTAGVGTDCTNSTNYVLTK